MTSDAALLGPKGYVYFDLAREAWLAPLERGSARRALLTGFLGICIAVAGVAFLAPAYGESLVLIPIGLFAIWQAWEELKPLGSEFADARRIGWTTIALDDGWATTGEPVTCRVTVHARRPLAPRAATLELVATRYERERVKEELARFAVPIDPLPPGVRGGDDWRAHVTFRMPDEAPPSWYSIAESVRWTLTCTIEFDDAEPWVRSYPLLVYPAPGSERD